MVERTISRQTDSSTSSRELSAYHCRRLSMRDSTASGRVVLVLLGLLPWCYGAQPFASERTPSVRVLSSQPDSVSGNDVLVEIAVASIHGWRVQLNGRDVTSLFQLSDV